MHKHEFVLAWKKNGIPFWRCIDDCDTEVGVNAIANYINTTEALSAEVKALKEKQEADLRKWCIGCPLGSELITPGGD